MNRSGWAAYAARRYCRGAVVVDGGRRQLFYSLIGPQFIELHVEARETATNVSTAIKVLIWDVPGLSGIKRDANSRGHTEGCR